MDGVEIGANNAVLAVLRKYLPRTGKIFAVLDDGPSIVPICNAVPEADIHPFVDSKLAASSVNTFAAHNPKVATSIVVDFSDDNWFSLAGGGGGASDSGTAGGEDAECDAFIFCHAQLAMVWPTTENILRAAQKVLSEGGMIILIGTAWMSPMDTDFRLSVAFRNSNSKSGGGDWGLRTSETITRVAAEQGFSRVGEILLDKPGRMALIFRKEGAAGGFMRKQKRAGSRWDLLSSISSPSRK